MRRSHVQFERGKINMGGMQDDFGPLNHGRRHIDDDVVESLALELAPDGVRVNAINPGVVRTNLHSATDTVPDYDAFLTRSEETHPLGFYGEPKDAAALVLFLARDGGVMAQLGHVAGEG